MNKVKDNGRIYTPVSIVRMMLNHCNYISNEYIQKKHVIDPSCGDGHILQEVVKRYIDSYNGVFSKEQLKDELKTYIHGIELDFDESQKCKDNLNKILDSYDIEHIDWDIMCCNSLTVTKFNNTMDFVIGNPPYVRMKNIKKSDETNEDYNILKSYSFSSKGMGDLYLAFYEFGLRLRNNTGVLCYIAPSSWINSQSGSVMRDYIYRTRELASVIDFGHKQVFENAQTYVMITLFDNQKHSHIRYSEFISFNEIYSNVYNFLYDDVFINGNMYFTNSISRDILKHNSDKDVKYVTVKNGYATLADDIFINNLPDFKNFTIPVIKASTGDWYRCLFPYDENFKLISLEYIKGKDENVYEYIINNEKKLKERSYDSKNIEGTWHSIGRSQGIKDTYINKISISNLLKKPTDLKIDIVESGCGVYGGMYIITDVPLSTISKLLISNSFLGYVKSLKKYKSSGYYTFSTKDVERYLNYMLNKKIEVV